MSITHSESGRPTSTQSSNGIEEVTDKSRDEIIDLSADRAPAVLIPVVSPVKIGSKNWETAEAVACEIIQKVQPTSVSEEKRREVISYIQRLIKNYLGVEVHTYGSVPLKTYLPDGDIDLTAFGGPNVEDSLIEDMKFVLEEEEKNTSASAEFVIKDVQLIRAEVKLVKCIVQNIVVDISVNQLGGLCTLCFLEKIDRLIGKDNLFKRSIILIKAWCYYESRILGAHHGLISTYALETLVLYIFHLYHSELDGPLAVLYKFLDYFSKFDWDTYCISLIGPIRLSSLPTIVVEMPEDSVGDLLLSTDFLSSCVEMFSVPSRGSDQNSRGFQRKHLNIVDPMKEFNNLGRSVNKGNFYRVCSAFTYGARKLTRILSQPENAIAIELQKFFSNTMARHGDRQRPGVHDFGSPLTRNGSFSTLPILKTGSCKMDNSTHHDSDEDTFATRDSQNGHANGIMTYGFPGLKISMDPSKTQHQNLKESIKLCHAPHLFFANSKIQMGSMKDEKLDSDNCDQSSTSKSEKTESLNLPTDLIGDYESHFQRLQYGRWCYENMLGMHSMHIPSSPTAPYQNGSWEGVMPLFKRNGFSSLHHNVFHPGPTVLMPGVPFGWEDISKPRGTGTYFPNMNQSPHGYMPSVITGRNWASSRPPYNNGTMIYPDPNLLDISSHEPPQYNVHGDKHAMVAVSESYQPFSPLAIGFPKANGFVFHPEGVAEFVPVDHTTGTSVSEKMKEQKPVSSSPKSVTQKEEPAFSKKENRFSYRLKDEDDFPPLSE